MVKVVAFSSTTAYAGGSSNGGEDDCMQESAESLLSHSTGDWEACDDPDECNDLVVGAAITASSYEGIGA